MLVFASGCWHRRTKLSRQTRTNYNSCNSNHCFYLVLRALYPFIIFFSSRKHLLASRQNIFFTVTTLLLTFTYKLPLFFTFRWDPKKRMTPDEAARHEWLQPSSSSSSSTYIVPKSSREHLKEISDSTNSYLQKYQRSQPITPNTVLPEIKTPSNRTTSQRFTKERAKGELENICCTVVKVTHIWFPSPPSPPLLLPSLPTSADYNYRFLNRNRFHK